MARSLGPMAAGTVGQLGARRAAGAGWLIAAAALAAAAFYVNRKTRRAEAATPPHGRRIEVDGVTLHVVERGAGPVVLLLHGMGTMTLDYELAGVVEQLAQTHRVIAIDRPGYAYSSRPRRTLWTAERQADLLAQAMRQMGVDHYTVLGHSYGALVGLALGLRHPQAVRALALAAGMYYPTLRLDTPLIGLPAVPLLGDLLRFTVFPLLARLLWPASTRALFAPQPVADAFRRDYPVWFALRPAQLRATAADALLALPSTWRLARRYGELKVPLALVVGDSDRYVSPRHTERLQAQVAGSCLLRVPGAGHMLHHSAPDALLDAVDDAERMAEGYQPTSAVLPTARTGPAAPVPEPARADAT